MSEALLKTFRRRSQGSREQEQIYNRAMRKIASARGMNKKPDPSLLTIAKEYKPETKAQLKRKQAAAANMGLTLVGGPLVKGAVKGVQLGRAALAGLPKGITKVRGGFKFGDKTYKTLGAAKGAATKAGKKPAPTPKTPAAPKPPADKVAAATRGRTTAAQRPNKTQRQLQRNEREAAKLQKAAGSGKKPPGKLKAAIVPATATAIGAREVLKDSKPGPKPAAAKKPAPKPRSTIADVKTKPKPLVKKQAPPKPVDSGRKAYNKGYETMKEYFVDDMTGRKSRVKTPFGTITIDSSDKGMAFEEYESKYGGQIKGTVKRRMGGKVRGFGKAMRGY